MFNSVIIIFYRFYYILVNFQSYELCCDAGAADFRTAPEKIFWSVEDGSRCRLYRGGSGSVFQVSKKIRLVNVLRIHSA